MRSRSVAEGNVGLNSCLRGSFVEWVDPFQRVSNASCRFRVPTGYASFGRFRPGLD